ncbi:MAG: hypothetical protein NTY36_10240 [Deltaproteobacteria bacterium]|nr:hypothetical protein [Deltaproteobacteria bacterium]
MMQKLHFLMLFAALGLMIFPAAGLGAGPRYLFQDLSPYGYVGYGRALDINDSGQVIFNSRKFYTPPGSTTDIGGSGGPASLNNTGQVVGHTWDIDGSQRAYLWTVNQGFQALAQIDLGYSAAYGINNQGQIVGTANGIPVRWDGINSITDLTTLGGLKGPGVGGSAAAINDTGLIACHLDLPDLGQRGALFTGTGWIILDGLIPDGGNCYPVALNNKGEVVGTSATLATGGGIHGFHWANGTMRDLGTLPGRNTSEALHINEAGQIVGTSYNYYYPDPYTDWVAVTWTSAGIQDLNTLVVNLPPKAVLRRAWAINNLGQIVGEFFDGNERPFLLTPLPPAGRVALNLLLLD